MSRKNRPNTKVLGTVPKLNRSEEPVFEDSEAETNQEIQEETAESESEEESEDAKEPDVSNETLEEPKAPEPVRWITITVPIFDGEIPTAVSVYDRRDTPLSGAINFRITGGNRPDGLERAVSRLKRGIQSQHCMLKGRDGRDAQHVDNCSQAMEYLLQLIAMESGEIEASQETAQHTQTPQDAE